MTYHDFLNPDQTEEQPEATPEPIPAPISSEQPDQMVVRTLPSNARLTSIDDILPPAERALAPVFAHIAKCKKEGKKVAFSDAFKAEHLPKLQAAQGPVDRMLKICKATKAPEYDRTKELSESLKEQIAALQQ